MNKKYLAQIKNSNLQKLLLKESNIPIIEDLLDVKIQRLITIKKNKNLDFGNKVCSKEELDEIFPKVKKDVDNFLDSKKSDMPSYGYCQYFNIFKQIKNPIKIYKTFSISKRIKSSINICLFNLLVSSGTNYNSFLESISLKKTRRVDMINNIIHEYDHHIQNKSILKNVFSKQYSFFEEGHAIGVERHLAEFYRKQEDNNAFIYKILNRTISEIKATYMWMCWKLEKPIRKSLLKNMTPIESFEISKILTLGEPTNHAKGNTFFSVYETKYKKQIYKDTIHENFQFK